MPTYFSKPENALTRADELIKVDKKQSALEVLSDVMKSKKHRNWQRVHEDIMMRFVTLCVELKKSVQFKEVIHQYKNIVLQVNPKTLEDVVKYYLKMARDKTEEARQESQQAVPDIDDLDVIQTPEKLILSAVTGEGAQDRSDRAILTPWLKFLWESYRQCLDLLRNNAKFEKLYHDVAQQSYEFCLKYGRKTEFRKLCDILRHHLNKFQQQTTQPTTTSSVNLNNPETQAYHLETRLKQLDHAMELELYMEAFKAVEDIWSLVLLSKKPPKPSLMANYYTKTALVFLKSGSHLFHAAALHKLYLLNRDQKKALTLEELQLLSSKVLCATLAIPLCHVREHLDTLLESGEISSIMKQKQLAHLLGIATPPTRQSLVKDLIRHGIPQMVYPELQKLYVHLDSDFHPLKIASSTLVAMDFIRNHSELNMYIEPIENIIISKTLLQVAQVHQTMHFNYFEQLCPFADTLRLERQVVTLIRDLELPIRLDHRNHSLNFSVYSDLGISQRENSPLAGSGGGSEQLACQLVTLGQALQNVLDMIQPTEQRDMEKAENRKYTIQAYRNSAISVNKNNLSRKVKIEERKEIMEKMSAEKDREEQIRRDQELRRQNHLEEERLHKEANEREQQRATDERAKLRKKMIKDEYNKMLSTDVGAKALENISEDQIADLEIEDFYKMQVAQRAKQFEELLLKARTQEKKFDYFTRAVRLEEIPILKQRYEEESRLGRERHELLENEKIELSKKEHARQLADKDRLSKMAEDVNVILDRLKKKQQVEFTDSVISWEQQCKEKRIARLEERKLKRKEDRKAEYIRKKKEKAEQERILAEKEAEDDRREQEAREAEEKEARAREESSMKRPVGELSSSGVGAWRPRTLQNRNEGDAKPTEERKYRPPGAADKETRDDPGSWRTQRGGDRDEKGSRGMDRDREGPRGMERDRDGPRGMERDREGPRGMERERDGPRGMERDRDGPRGMERDRDGPRGMERDRDGPRGMDRDREGPRGMERDRDGPRGMERDRDGPRGMERDRDGPRGMDRDREGPRGMEHDRDGPRGMDRDRAGGLRGMDRERDGPRGMDRDRAGGLRGMDRDRDGPRGMDRERDPPRGMDRDRDGPRGMDRERDAPRGMDRERDGGPRGMDRDNDGGSRGLDRARGYDDRTPRGGGRMDRDHRGSEGRRRIGERGTTGDQDSWRRGDKVQSDERDRPTTASNTPWKSRAKGGDERTPPKEIKERSRAKSPEGEREDDGWTKVAPKKR